MTQCTPREVKNFVRRYQTDLILLDCGFEVEREVRLLKEIKAICLDVPVIFLTDDNSSSSAVAAFRAVAREIVGKPANIFELQNTIKNLLEMKKSSREKRTPFVLYQNQSSDTREPVQTITTDKPINILRVINYINENISDVINIEILAKEANLSKYHFCRIFKRHIGMSPIKFVTSMRILRAKELLQRDDLTVSELAFHVGFNDLGTFIRQFKKFTRLSPTIYKNSLKEIKAQQETEGKPELP